MRIDKFDVNRAHQIAHLSSHSFYFLNDSIFPLLHDFIPMSLKNSQLVYKK